MRTSRDQAFLSAAQTSMRLLGHHEVAARWEEQSLLPRMTVGMLACHLGRQVVRAHEILPVQGSDEPLAETTDHYRRAAWVTSDDLEDPANDRTSDETEANLGVEVMLCRCADALLEVDRLLSAGTASDVVAIPWQGWALRREDFLLTRMVEIVTHTDDLARSVGVPTPTFPDEVYLPVLNLLARLAAERHGQAAMTSALTRRERMPQTISAF
jgi:hypothetical protein